MEMPTQVIAASGVNALWLTREVAFLNVNTRTAVKNRVKPVLEVGNMAMNFMKAPIAYRLWYLKHAKRLLKFRDMHKGQDCFIIGNGPSLNNMDLSLLNNYHTFGLNKIHLLLDEVGLHLDYHVAVNPYVIQQSATEFQSLSCTSFLSYQAAKHVVTPSDNTYYIATSPKPYTFVEEITDSICEGYTVTYVAMQIAYYMGFENVFLIGVDHKFTVNGEPNSLEFMEGEDMNHFSPEYFKNKEWHLPDLEASELSYHMARFFYTRAGRNIFDATEEGLLDVFPKISYEEALSSCKTRR
jgi:hypothetical protein